jgi:Ras-related protein Rab-7A
VKAVVLGESSVGKTAMIRRFCDGRFTDDFKATVGTDFSTRSVTFPHSDSDVKLQLWDTAGQERYRSLSTTYFRGCEVAIIVFDVTSEESFKRIGFWIEEVARALGQAELNGFPVYVVGNKIDVAPSCRVVAASRAREVCRGKGVMFMECSAKTGEFVEAVFRAAAAAALDRRDDAAAEEALPTASAVKVPAMSEKIAQRKKENCSC